LILIQDLQIPGANATPTSSPQSRLISKFLTETTLSGLRLTGTAKDDFIETVQTLDQERENYRRNLQTATSRFKHLVIDPKYVGSMPHDGLLTISKSGQAFIYGFIDF
jgi:Zn-dependent oligopeptidase